MIDFSEIVKAAGTYESRKAAAQSLKDTFQFTGPLADVLLKGTSEQRQTSRVEYLQRGLKEAFIQSIGLEDGAQIDDDDAALAAFTMMIVSVELNGVGGEYDARGSGTQRTPLFERLCGTGRRLAHDGPTWDAALTTVRDSAAAILLTDLMRRGIETTGLGGSVVVLQGLAADYDDAEVYLAHHGTTTEVLMDAADLVTLLGTRHLKAEAVRAAIRTIQSGGNWSGEELSNWFTHLVRLAENEAAQALTRLE